MWHLHFWVPTCLFFELLFRALRDLSRSCRSSSQLCLALQHMWWAKAPATIMTLKRNRPLSLPSSSTYSTKYSSACHVPCFSEIFPVSSWNWVEVNLPCENLSHDGLFWEWGVGRPRWTPSLALHHGTRGKSCLSEALQFIIWPNPLFCWWGNFRQESWRDMSRCVHSWVEFVCWPTINKWNS